MSGVLWIVANAAVSRGSHDPEPLPMKARQPFLLRTTLLPRCAGLRKS
jgi:hypothetical protein